MESNIVSSGNKDKILVQWNPNVMNPFIMSSPSAIINNTIQPIYNRMNGAN